MSFIEADFMLNNETGKRIYHQYAATLPIFDYHCHLSPREISEDHVFSDITELWLSGDHYKWRAMRANGIPEYQITGEASSREKFRAWAETAENAIGNPLYHWTQLELKKYFDIKQLLTSENADEMFDQINVKLKSEELTARKLIKQSDVSFIGTTDRITDPLNYHKNIAEDKTFDVTVVPAFRPDDLLELRVDTITKLEKLNDESAESYDGFIKMVENRVDYFSSHGSMISDHGIGELIYTDSTSAEIEKIYQKLRKSGILTEMEQKKWISNLLIDLAGMYEKRNWIMQIHFGAIRNNHNGLFETYGADAGADSIADQPYLAKHLNSLLGAMEKQQKLPKMILYNLNSEYNHIVASTVANFQSNSQGIKGKIQFGAGWWFNDTEQGILRQLETLADHGLLMHFVGMITDSRSFISYPRHDYFRRILCNFIGQQVEMGKYPNEEKLLRKLITNICYENAKNYFRN